MVATMSVRYDFGGVDGTPGTNQDIDALGPPTLKFKKADNATIDSLNPVSIPTAGNGPYYSWWKQIYLYCDAADGKTISNVKLWTSGTNTLGTGIDMNVGLQFPTRNSGATTGYEVANTDSTMVTNHTGISSVASIFNYTSASPLAISISEAGNVINANGETTNYIVLQESVANTVPEGTTTTGTGTAYLSYDSA